ncbi:hypothetical protein ACFV3R_17305 [Streptomyces sp. NPDC059740]|uniref:hypothetical protein n=1 Tax=Streptomyces sp. NPDC059740 TaxID=3346926 RepID=UPI003656B714
MTAVEDRLRAALHARAGQVTTLRPVPPPSTRARVAVRPGLRRAAVVLLAAALAAVLLVLPRLLSRGDDPSVPADTPPPHGPSTSTRTSKPPSPAPSSPGESPGPVAP